MNGKNPDNDAGRCRSLAEQGSALAHAPSATRKAERGVWEFPGGKVEHGETQLQALVREIGEETGVTLNASSLEQSGFAWQELVIVTQQLSFCFTQRVNGKGSRWH